MSEANTEEKKALKGDRVRFGLGTILYQSEETGLGPVPTAIVRCLGGDDRHIGMFSSLTVFGGIFKMAGNPLLKWKASNRAAMIFTMKLGVLFAGLIAIVLFTSSIPSLRAAVLPLYMGLSILLASASMLQGTVEMNWIGDLVPIYLRGWFTKIKWILSVCGAIVFTIGIARISQMYPNMYTYAGIYLFISLSHVVAAKVLYPKATDKKPKVANFVSEGETGHERINYKIPVLWLNFIFGMFWGPARMITGAFVPIYLMHQFNFSLTKIALLLVLQQVMSIAVIAFIGDKTDRWGSRKPLIILTSLVAFSMSLWFFSAWLGIGCAIAYMVINGAAGHTMSMLGSNFQLEIYPSKGRAAYVGFYTLIGLPITFATTFFSGYLVHNLHDFHFQLLGADLTRYHLVFLATTLMAFISVVPLILTGHPKVQAASKVE